MQRIAVFCGSNVGDSPEYRAAASELGRIIAMQDLGLVFGGTSKGLMASVAEGVARKGGRIHGVITQGLVDKGQSCTYSTELEVVESRSERKLRMAGLADAFVALPGGVGTLEELFEVWVNAQLEGHSKPMGLLNTAGFYDNLLLFLDEMVKRAFLPPAQRGMILVAPDPAGLIEHLRCFEPVVVSKWL